MIENRFLDEMKEGQDMLTYDYTVATTVYNDEDNIISLIKNIEEQTVLPKEMIIADGGSKDCTVSAVKEYALLCKFPIKVIYGERLNIAQGFNKAIREATTDFIGIVACGNHYCTNYFETLLKDFSKDISILVTYSAIKYVGSTKFGKAYSLLSLKGKESVVCKVATNHGNICKREIFNKYGYFYESFQYAGEDSEFFLRLNKEGAKMYGDSSIWVEWEIPNSYQELGKQIKHYVIADMEMYENITFLKGYIRKILYALCLPISAILMMFPNFGVKCVGLILVGIFIYKSFKKLFEYGIECWKIFNYREFYSVIIMIRNWRLFLKKNKIKQINDFDFF